MSLRMNQSILPAVHKIKDIEAVVKSNLSYIVLLGGHIGQLQSTVAYAKQHDKKVFLHADLIDGLKNDEYATDFLCQTIAPTGIISTRANVVLRTKQKGLIAIQRVFLLDSDALNRSYKLIEKTQPDFIEVLPGIMPEIITEVKEQTGIPVIAGGLIRSIDHVEKALQSGAIAITTSRKDLWKHSIVSYMEG